MTTRTKHNFGLAIGALLVGLAVFVVLWNFGGKSEPSSTPPVAGAQQYVVPANQPEVLVDLTGKWVYKQNGTAFVAEVKNGGIHIDLVSSDGTSMNYWVGTFKDSAKVGVKLNSNVDTNEITLSQSSNKTFTIGENSISFEFQAMGMKKQIELTR